MIHLSLGASMVGIHWKHEFQPTKRGGGLSSVIEVQLVDALLVAHSEDHSSAPMKIQDKSIVQTSRPIEGQSVENRIHMAVRSPGVEIAITSAVPSPQLSSESIETEIGDQDSTLVKESLQPASEFLSGDQKAVPTALGQEGNAELGGDEKMQFLQEVRSRLEKAKSYPLKARLKSLEGTVRLEFYINPMGEPEEIRVVESSGWETLDQEGLTIVRRAGQFPHLPREWEMGIHIQVPLVFKLDKL